MPKLTILQQSDFEKDMQRVSEVGYAEDPKTKQTFTPRLNTIAKPDQFEFTTQESVQSRILKTHLKEADSNQSFPRLELELEREESKQGVP